MIGIGSAIGAGLKVAGSIGGGIAASRAARRVKRNIEGQQKENEDWFDRRYNEDGTQRADAQRMINMVNESIKKRNRQAAGTAAVMGGSQESVALAKEANNEALSNTASAIAAKEGMRKDGIERTFLANKADLNDQLNNVEMRRAEGIARSVQDVAAVAAGIKDNLE